MARVSFLFVGAFVVTLAHLSQASDPTPWDLGETKESLLHPPTLSHPGTQSASRPLTSDNKGACAANKVWNTTNIPCPPLSLQKKAEPSVKSPEDIIERARTQGVIEDDRIHDPLMN